MNQTEEKDDNTDVVDDLVEPLIDKATAYGKTSLELLKLRAVQRASIMAPAVISRTIILVLLALFLLVLTMGVAIWLGDMLGKMYYGFFIVAGFYGLLTLVFHAFFRKKLKQTIGDWIISELL